MATKWGTFSEPGYLHPGALHNKAFKSPKETGLAGFKVLGCTKTGKTNDATFSKFASVHAGDIFQDAQTRLAAKGKGRKVVKEEGVPFKPGSPMKQAPAPQAGTFYGTIGGKIPYEPNPQPRRKKDEITHPLRQITTNPMKKGGFGFNKTTLSESTGYKGVMGEYEYHANPLDWHEALDKDKAKKGTESTAFRPPTVGRVGSLFNKIEYMPLGAPIKVTRKERAESAPFKPPHTGGTGPLGKPYEYIPCPALKKDTAKKSEGAAWRPNFDHRTGSTPSVMRTNLHGIHR